MLGEGVGEVYDLETHQLSTWPRAPLMVIGAPPCMVSWKENLIVFGAYDDGRFDKVQMFNTRTEVRDMHA